MRFSASNHARWWRPLAALLLVLGMTGCASFYVDGNTREVPSSQYTKPTRQAPVQVLFEFQTKGAANARATDLLKARVITQVQDSGLFSSVSERPMPGAGLLAITLNNVPLSDDAFTQGVMTGLTFGLAGAKVSDGYICTARYVPADGGTPLVKSARHAIHTTMGAASNPANATKADNATEAVFTVTRQVLSQVLKDLSQAPDFKP